MRTTFSKRRISVKKGLIILTMLAMLASALPKSANAGGGCPGCWIPAAIVGGVILGAAVNNAQNQQRYYAPPPPPPVYVQPVPVPQPVQYVQAPVQNTMTPVTVRINGRNIQCYQNQSGQVNCPPGW